MQFQKISIPIKEGHWKFRGGGGSQKSTFLKERMKLNWNFQRSGGSKTKKPSMAGVWIFSETKHCLVTKMKSDPFKPFILKKLTNNVFAMQI